MRPITGLARSILEGIAEAVCILDPNHTITYINPTAERLTLWPLDQVSGRACDEVFGDELRSVAAPSPSEAGPQSGPTAARREASIVTRPGATIDVIVSASWLGDAAAPDGIMLVLSGVDSSREHPDPAADLASFPELNPNPVLEVAPSGTVTYANPSAEYLLPGLTEMGKGHPFLAGLDALLRRLDPDGRKAHLREIRIGDVWYEQSWWLAPATGRALVCALDVSERVRTEQSLRDSEARFRTAFEDATVAMLLTDTVGNVRGLNEAFCRLLGYTHEELDAMVLTMVIHPDDADAERAHRERLLAGDVGAIRFDKRYIRKDGEMIRAEVSLSLLRSVGGSPLHFVSVVLDLVARSEPEASPPTGERHPSDAWEYSPIGMSLTALDGSLLEANRALCAMLGFSEQELLSNTRADLGYPDDVEMTRQQMAALVGAEPRLRRFGQRFMHRDGHVVWTAVSSVLLRDTAGHPLHFIDYIEDISAQRRAEEELQSSLERYRALYESLPGGVIVVDRSFIVTDANPGVREILCEVPEDTVGHNIHEAFWEGVDEAGTPFLEDTHPFAVTLRTGKGVRGLVMGLLSQSGGETRWILVNSEPLRDEETGDVQAALVNFVDITDRKSAEADSLASDAEFRELFDRMPSGVVVYEAIHEGEDFVIRDLNQASEAIEGVEKAMLVGRTVTEAYPGVGEMGILEAMRRVWRTGEAEHLPVCEYRDDRIQGWRENDVYKLPSGVVVAVYEDRTEQKHMEAQLRLSAEVLRVLNEPGNPADAIKRVLTALKAYTGFDAVGIRLQTGDDFPFAAQEGFSDDFLLTEETLLERAADGGVCRDKDGNVSLECTCGLVLSGNIPASHRLFTPRGSFWTNDSLPLLDLPPDEDPRHRPRNECIHQGYASVALVPLRSREQTVGLLQLNDKRPDRLTLELVQFLEGLGDTVGIALAHKRAEDALRESEELYRRILHDQTEMICRSLPDGTITFINDAYCRFFGRSHEDLIGTSTYSLMPEEIKAQLTKAVAGLTPEQPMVTIELPFSLAEGRTGWTQWVHRNFFDATGRLVETQATGSDITALKAAQEAYRLAAVGQLAAGVAHDFNNLLLAIGGTAQMVEMGRCEPARLVDTVVKSTRRGAEITRNLMAFARPEEPRRASGHLETSLDAALAVANRQLANAEIDVVRRYPAASRPVVFDATQMEQVFLNLIINASHAMPRGGTLTVGTEYPSASSETAEAVIRVTDTGTGIASEHLDHIFEPFFTTKGRPGESETPGSGLGLSVSYGLVTAHGGTIAVSSELGFGTTFEIRLPLSEEMATVEEPADDTAIAQRDIATLKGARLLVAEDETDVLLLLRGLFDAIGCELVTAATASEAIEALRGQEFDLVLADLMMPGGGGRAVLKFSRTLGTDASPVIIMTGRLERALHDEVMALGAARSIEKPFNLSELLRVLAEVLGSRR